jgi:hypothetical protein
MNFLTTLLFSLLISITYGQNFVIDGGFENFTNCPSQLDFESYIQTWQEHRGSPDYFNDCSENGIGFNNPFGFQQSFEGEGYAGVITSVANLPNCREVIVTDLLESTTIGEEYWISMNVSYAFKNSTGNLTSSNNLGILLMTENYLSPNAEGELPNFAHLKFEELVEDTTDWTTLSGWIIADSIYTKVAIGNFFDDSNTVTNYPFTDPQIFGYSYYYIDGFCLSTNQNCDGVLSDNLKVSENLINLFPTVSTGQFSVHTLSQCEVEVYDLSGVLVDEYMLNAGINELKLNISSGIYLMIPKSTVFNGSVARKFIITN